MEAEKLEVVPRESVLIALVVVETEKSGSVCPSIPAMARVAPGDEVPIPTLPSLVTMKAALVDPWLDMTRGMELSPISMES